MSKQLSVNLAVVAFERLLQITFSILTLQLITNYLSVSDSGKFTHALNLGALLITFSFFAGSELLTPKLARYHFAKRHIISNGLYLRLFFAAIALIITHIYARVYVTDPDIRYALQIYAAGPILAEAFYTFSCWFNAERNNIYISIARIFGVLVRFFGVYALIAWHKYTIHAHTAVSTLTSTSAIQPQIQGQLPLYWLSVPFFLEPLIIALVVIIFYIRHPDNVGFGKFNKKLIYLFAGRGTIIGIALLANYGFVRLDRIILETAISHYDLGIYNIAMQLNDAWLNMGIMLCTVLGPQFIFTHQPRKFVVQKMGYLSLVLAGFALMVSLCTQVVSQQFVVSMFGEQYHHAAFLLNKAVWISIPAFISQLLSLWWLREKRYHIQIYVYLLGIATLFASYYGYIYLYAAGNVSIASPVATHISAHTLQHVMLFSVGLAYIVMCLAHCCLIAKYKPINQ